MKQFPSLGAYNFNESLSISISKVDTNKLLNFITNRKIKQEITNILYEKHTDM